MHLPLILATALAMAPSLVSAQWQINFYSDTGCNDYAYSWTGQNSNPSGTQLDYNNYIGSFIVVEASGWMDEFDYSYNPSECGWYDATCCSGAPSCMYENFPGVSSGTRQCNELNMNVGTIWAGLTVCNSACFDNDYRRMENSSKVERAPFGEPLEASRERKRQLLHQQKKKKGRTAE